MPYIKQDRRKDFHAGLQELELQGMDNAAELNYLISMLCKKYTDSRKFNYDLIKDMKGTLDLVWIEWERLNKVNEYERSKEKENGPL